MEFRRGRWPRKRPATPFAAIHAAAEVADFEVLFQATPTPILLVDPDIRSILNANAAASRLYGYREDEFAKLNLSDICTDAEGCLKQASASPSQETISHHRTKSGEQRVVKVSATEFHHGVASALLVTVSDVTREHELQREATSARSFLANVIERVPIALFVKEALSGKFIIYNSGAERLFNVSRHTLIGNTSLVFGPEEAREFMEQDRMTIDAGSVGTVVEKVVRDPQGSERIIRIKKVAVEDGEECGRHYILAAAEDVTEERTREERIAHLASHDSLTGLANRWLFHQRLGALRSQSGSPGTVGHIALHYVDLDGFKAVNDQCGHPTGDEVLKIAAGRMRDATRENDLVARLGGDEFAILQHIISQAEAEMLAERLLTRLCEPYVAARRTCDLSASIGICVANIETPIEHLVEEADRALYAAKRNGKSRYVISSLFPAGGGELRRAGFAR